MDAGDGVLRVGKVALGRLHPSRTALYRLAKPLHRPLGRAADDKGRLDGSEFLAVPTEERYDRDTNYRPPELERYLADQQRVRLEPVLLPNLDARQREEGGRRWPEGEAPNSRSLPLASA
ncbi:hypothetical protein ABT173_35205 [Streptomyces sp. NPDC001795]|uniref:hypothetical protein n=1 Tax=Streptomyces sp. NPDC001795 TaxID=3154525 RepID=UPI0033179C39